jgi:hypothetical protein
MNQYPETYHVAQRPSTGSAALVLIAGLSLASPPHYELPRATAAAAKPLLTSSTVGQYGAILASPTKSQPAEFERTVGEFYTSLLAEQEPLGKEFERILYDNLWDLYVRS